MQISDLICIFINTDENFRKYGNCLKKKSKCKLNTVPKTVLVECYYNISDTFDNLTSPFIQ